MMNTQFFRPLAFAASLCLALPALAGVSPEEAARLNADLTPFGAERAGNADGSIPAWTGGYTTPIAGDVPGGTRGDPFRDEQPLFVINAQNMDQHADRLSDGVKAMLQKHPETYRLNVYPTHRTAAAPQWVYDNTFKNATRASFDGKMPVGAYGGIPFPIPQSAEEIMWNHLLRWRGVTWQTDHRQYQITPQGRMVLTTEGIARGQMPYYFEDGSPESFAGYFWLINVANDGPPIRAGEMIVGQENVNPDRSATYVYLTGQRRVRRLPNACCDTPAPATAGLMSFDEIGVWNGRMDRFDWRIVGKQELFIPYNANKWFSAQSDSDLVSANHLNPDYVRWELHRVWVVEATLRSGQRHQAHRSRYYVDEDTWAAVLADRWDANGQLWKSMFTLPMVMPDAPATVALPTGFYDMLSGSAYIAYTFANKSYHHRFISPLPETTFTGQGLAAQGVR